MVPPRDNKRQQITIHGCDAVRKRLNKFLSSQFGSRYTFFTPKRGELPSNPARRRVVQNLSFARYGE